MRGVLAITALCVILVGGWLGFVWRWHQSVQPGGTTLAAVLTKHPQHEHCRVFSREGREFLALFGPLRGLPRFPSGWPVYVFDRSGTLVDWTADEGDDEAFRRRWLGIYDGRAVTQAEVQQWSAAGQ